MTEVIVKIIEDDPSQHADGVDSQTQILKDFGMSLPEIKDFIAANLPPPPTPPEEVERRRQIQEELERLEAAEKERERLAALKPMQYGPSSNVEIKTKSCRVPSSGSFARLHIAG